MFRIWRTLSYLTIKRSSKASTLKIDVVSTVLSYFYHMRYFSKQFFFYTITHTHIHKTSHTGFIHSILFPIRIVLHYYRSCPHSHFMTSTTIQTYTDKWKTFKTKLNWFSLSHTFITFSTIHNKKKLHFLL